MKIWEWTMGNENSAKEKRIVQLVAREGMMDHLLETYDFPTENHRKIIELIQKETIELLGLLGVKHE